MELMRVPQAPPPAAGGDRDDRTHIILADARVDVVVIYALLDLHNDHDHLLICMRMHSCSWAMCEHDDIYIELDRDCEL
jgi:hypothetical protein